MLLFNLATFFTIAAFMFTFLSLAGETGMIFPAIITDLITSCLWYAIYAGHQKAVNKQEAVSDRKRRKQKNLLKKLEFVHFEVATAEHRVRIGNKRRRLLKSIKTQLVQKQLFKIDTRYNDWRATDVFCGTHGKYSLVAFTHSYFTEVPDGEDLVREDWEQTGAIVLVFHGKLDLPTFAVEKDSFFEAAPKDELRRLNQDFDNEKLLEEQPFNVELWHDQSTPSKQFFNEAKRVSLSHFMVELDKFGPSIRYVGACCVFKFSPLEEIFLMDYAATRVGWFDSIFQACVETCDALIS